MTKSTSRAPQQASALLTLAVVGLACIPSFGLGVWFIGGPILLAAFILSIIAMSKGSIFDGVAAMLLALIVGPAAMLCAPLVSTYLAHRADAENAKPSSPATWYGERPAH